MKVAITGATGLIGSALTEELHRSGHTTVRMVRREAGPDEVSWDPTGGELDTDGLGGVDAVVHLAADPIEPKPLTQGKRQRLRNSRVAGTATIARALAGMPDGPRVLLSASGVNAYGDRGDEVLTESSERGDDGFLSRITTDWEAALDPAREAGLRVVALRTGIVLDTDATILKVMGRLTKLGGAAPVGDGQQWWPWVALDDVAGAYAHALTDVELDGVVNVTSPNPVTNETFTRTIAEVLHRPVMPIKVPRFAPGLYLGDDLARSLLFTSMRVHPERLLERGYTFRHPELEDALRALYDR